MKVRANGLSIEVQVEGEGEPLLMIMGIGSQLILWPQGVVDGLVAEGFQVIRFDNRDAGLSERLDHLAAPNLARVFAKRVLGIPMKAGYTLSDMAADAMGVLDALGVERAHVVGASMGGMIAQLCAIECPKRVASLTSIMSSTGRARDGLPNVGALRALLERPPPTDAESYAAGIADFFELVGGPYNEVDRPGVLDYGRASWERGRTSPAAFSRQAAAIASTPKRNRQLAKLSLPTLVVHGGADPLVPPTAGRATARAIPGAVYLEFAGMGHYLPARIWPDLVAAITRLARLAPQSDRAERTASG